MPPPGETGGDHSRSAAVFSGVQPKKTVSDDIHLGTTIDQIIAQKYGQDNAAAFDPARNRRSELARDLSLGLQLRVREFGFLVRADQAASARSQPASRLRAPVRRRQQRRRNATARKQAKASLLDAVSLEVARLNKTLPATDRTRLNEYLEDIREIERRLSNVAKSSEQSPDVQVPFGMPESFNEHINLMWDLQVLAFRADITRVSTLMYAHDVSMRVYPECGVTSGNHPTSHHGGSPATVEAWAKINRYHVQCLTPFLAKLKSTPDGDGNLLDHTLILWASNMSDGNLHSHKDVPNMWIGGAMGQHKAAVTSRGRERPPTSC